MEDAFIPAMDNASDILTDHPIEQDCFSLLFSNLKQINDYGLYCLFAPNRQIYKDKKALIQQFQIAFFNLSATGEGLALLNAMSELLKKNFSLRVLSEIEILYERADTSEDSRFIFYTFLTALLRNCVDKAGEVPPNPQLLNYLLDCFAERQPDFLMIVDPFIKIILNKDRVFSREFIQKTAEIASLNYTPQVVHIYAACNPTLDDIQKNTIFQILTAYAKIKRLLSLYQHKSPEIVFDTNSFYDLRETKDMVARHWFNISYAEIKKDPNLYAAGNERRFVKKFLSCVCHNHIEDAEQTAKALVLTVNDEDTIRIANDILIHDREFESYRYKSEVINLAYRILYRIMQDYRRLCKKNTEDEQIHTLVSNMAIESRKNMLNFLETQYPASNQDMSGRGGDDPLHALNDHAAAKNRINGFSGSISSGTFKAMPQIPAYELLKETHENLNLWNLKGLFDVYPVPPKSQTVINRLCRIGKTIPLEGTTEKLNFLIYIEKVLELLQQIESLGIKLTSQEDNGEPTIYNTFQLSVQDVVRKEERETYLISTGYWRQHNKIKPGIFKIFGPCSMINCSGNFSVSLGLQILSSSGHFYAAPMALDHTLRYPQDYEPHEPCFDRAGWLHVTIPPVLRASWSAVQEYQLKTTGLSKIIQDTIRKANDPSQRPFVPVTNIDGFWDA